MKTFFRSQGLGFYAAVALLAGCGGAQLGSNQIQPNASQTGTTPALFDHTVGSRPAPGRSWMAPEAKKSDLTYISNFYSSDVLAFTYPGGKYAGTISGVTDAQGECTSKTSDGNWWVVASGADEVLEYAHGGTMPLKALSEAVGEPAGCTVDPTTGNLAVTILGTGDIVVFAGGSGSGATLSDSLSSTYFASYDDKGELFVDGITSSDTYGVVELPQGSTKFETITMSPSLEFPGGLQWHGNYLAVGGGGGIYHFAIHGTKGKEIGFTPLGDVVQFWIAGRYVVGTDFPNEDAEMWKYPAGGPVFRTLKGEFDGPIGATVSVAKKR
jgi:hypothetical protein